MEDALVPRIKFINHKQGGLNPCCNGRCTRTAQNFIYNLNKTRS